MTAMKPTRTILILAITLFAFICPYGCKGQTNTDDSRHNIPIEEMVSLKNDIDNNTKKLERQGQDINTVKKDISAIKKDLEAINTDNKSFFLIALVFGLIAFIISLVALFKVRKPTQIQSNYDDGNNVPSESISRAEFEQLHNTVTNHIQKDHYQGFSQRINPSGSETRGFVTNTPNASIVHEQSSPQIQSVSEQKRYFKDVSKGGRQQRMLQTFIIIGSLSFRSHRFG